MKIQLIGHASLFVETQDCRVLMDPVFGDTFCDGLNATCPQREVFAEKIPEFDFLVISHQHLDHFDLPTLASLPNKKVDVLIPRDRTIENCLRQLGYSRIYPIRDFQKIKVGATKMIPTRSEIPVPEYGMIFADDSGVFWNAVDTLFAPQTIQRIRAEYPQIDLLLTPWHISLEGKYQYNQSIAFPFSLYSHLFYLIGLVGAKAVVPGAQGFKYINESAWQNQVVFPTTRERFCHDLKLAFPEIAANILTFDPGDTLTLDRDELQLDRDNCEFARTIVDDRACLDFGPTKIGVPLIDCNPENHPRPVLAEQIDRQIEVELPAFITTYQNSVFLEHRHWQVIYQLEVIFPDRTQIWSIDFSRSTITAVPGRNPLANLFTSITASCLYALMEKQRDWDYLVCSGEYRTFHKIYAVARHGIVAAENSVPKDPLELRFPSVYIAGKHLDREVSKLIDPERASLPADEDDNPMIAVGNILLKCQPNHHPQANVNELVKQ
jgi:UDP-MurNAc hydroxylase